MFVIYLFFVELPAGLVNARRRCANRTGSGTVTHASCIQIDFNSPSKRAFEFIRECEWDEEPGERALLVLLDVFVFTF